VPTEQWSISGVSGRARLMHGKGICHMQGVVVGKAQPLGARCPWSMSVRPGAAVSVSIHLESPAFFAYLCPQMKIAQVLIQSAAALSDFQIDLTYPEGHPKAGQALDRVCLIGPNGSGKSRLLGMIADYLRNTLRFKSKSLFLLKLELSDRSIYSVHINNNALLMRTDIDQEPMWMFELIRDGSFTMAFNKNYEAYCIGHEEEPALYDELWFDNNGLDLVVHQPADYARDRTIGLVDSPVTKSHEAESLLETFPLYGEVTPEKTTEFWALLIYLIQRREKQYKEFADKGDNRGKPEASLKAAFAEIHPEVLPALAQVWAPILDHLHLVLDVGNALIPNHIKEKLSLTLKHKVTGQKVDYGDLGTGLRRLLFNLGHTWALYFDRKIHHGFCILEEPESGLHPSFIAQIIPQYEALIQGSQLFVSTHNPQIAAAFDPAERIILARDAKGQVSLRRSDCAPDADLATIFARDFA
jgi:energy-coupling factor transporter ATP-binding protein EcfA2